MIAIFMIILVLFLVLVGWMWNSLGTIEKKVKVVCIIIGFVFIYMLTFIIYNISKIGITYEDRTVMKIVRNVYVFLFTIVNGYILLPYVFKKLEQINNDELERQLLIRSIIILLIIFVILSIFEIKYLGKMQQGIINLSIGDVSFWTFCPSGTFLDGQNVQKETSPMDLTYGKIERK